MYIIKDFWENFLNREQRYEFIKYIRDNLNIEEVYFTSTLEEWAYDHGFILPENPQDK